MSALSSLAAPCNHLPARLIPLGHPLAPERRNRGWVWGYVGCEGLRERRPCTCINFKLNRAAALAEWRQLFSA